VPKLHLVSSLYNIELWCKETQT